MKKYQILIVILVSLLFSCSEKNRNVSDFLRTEANKKGINYDKLLERSFLKNREAIIKISTLKFSNSANSENGSMILEIIDSIGEVQYSMIISNCNSAEKNAIYYNILGGLDFTNNKKYRLKDFDSTLPVIYKTLGRGGR